MSALVAPGFTDWDELAPRSSKAQPVPGTPRGDLPALAGRPLRAPTRALGWYDAEYRFCVPGQPQARTALGDFENTTFWVPLPPFDGTVVDARVMPPEAACPACPTAAAANGVSGLGCNCGAGEGLGQLSLPFGMDTQSLVWIAGIGLAGFLMLKLLGLDSRKAKAAALRKARASYYADVAKIRKRYA